MKENTKVVKKIIDMLDTGNYKVYGYMTNGKFVSCIDEEFISVVNDILVDILISKYGILNAEFNEVVSDDTIINIIRSNIDFQIKTLEYGAYDTVVREAISEELSKNMISQ